ncbi:MAG: hypothetical protein LBM71_05690 [Elusimicrobiota bacterium]|nr:hypothetical protein [Elusimicrobiota bacterium]
MDTTQRVNRLSNPPCLTLTKAEIINIETISTNLDKLYNRVNINFGAYTKTIDCEAQGEPRPNLIDKYGVKELNITGGAFLPAQNANLARACAPNIYAQTCRIKNTATLNIKFTPQLELSDSILLVYDNYFSGPQLIEGIEYDLENWLMRLEVSSEDVSSESEEPNND